MDFDFSDDQQQLREAARRWVEKAYPFEHRRAAVAAGGFARNTWSALAELGLTALQVPEVHGGLGMGPVEAMVVMEEMGRGLVLEPLAQSLLAAQVLSRYAPPSTQAQWLPRVASGDALVVLAHQERRARYRLEHCESKAVQTTDGYRLSAQKSLVPAGDQADAFLVPALLDGHLALFLLARDADGVSVSGYQTQTGSRAAEVEAAHSPATLLTTDGLAALELAVDTASAAICAEAVGAMEAMLAITADYMNQRKQFGVPIASFQALRHRLADMKMQLELARSMSYYASLKLQAPADQRRRAIARARVQLSQSMRYVGQQSVQLHGGIGVTDEYIISHYFKHLTQLEMSYGDGLHHLSELSARMLETAGVGEG